MDTSSWKNINIKKIFDISYGNKLDMCQMTPNRDGIAFVTRTATNNGVGGIVEPIDGVTAYPAGSLSVALGGSIGSTFLQTRDFYTSQNVAVLQPKETLSTEILLFLATLIEKECCLRFVAFGRELNKHIKKDFTIKLPLLEEDKPNWNELEIFVKDRILPQLPKKAQKVWLQKYDTAPQKQENMKLNTQDWKWFVVGELFDVKAGKYHYSSEYEEGKTPYLSATSVNNGIGDLISLSPEFNGGVLTTEKVGCTAFYQPKPFCATSDVNIIKRKDGKEMNPYVCLFLASIIDFNESYRWTYGRQCRVNDTQKIRIKLPATPSGEPDWQFMEDYIKSLPYSKNLEPSDPKEVIDELMEVKRHVIEMERKMEALNGASTVNIIGSNVTYLDHSRTFHIEK